MKMNPIAVTLSLLAALSLAPSMRAQSVPPEGPGADPAQLIRAPWVAR